MPPVLAVAPLVFTARGVPKPQGSKVRTKTGVRDAAGQPLESWRDTVTAAALKVVEARGGGPLWPRGAPVVVTLRFFMPPTAAAERAHARGLETVPCTRPDWEKISRAVGDAMTVAGVYRDDGQVARAIVDKLWALDRPPGVDVTVSSWIPVPNEMSVWDGVPSVPLGVGWH